MNRAQLLPTIRAGAFNLALVAVSFWLGRIAIDPAAPAWFAKAPSAVSIAGPVSKLGHTLQPRAPIRKPGAPTADEDIKAALDSIGRPSDRSAYEQMLKLLRSWVASNPEAALAYAVQNLKQPFQGEALGTLLAAWTDRNPRAAWEWVTGRFSGDADRIDAVLRETAISDPDLAWRFALAYAAQHPDEARGRCVGALQGMLYAGSYESALRLLAATELPSGTPEMTALVITEWGRYDPRAAADAAIALSDSATRARSLASLAQSWSDSDPFAASTFAAELPVGPARQAMLNEALGVWSEHDTNGISSWLDAYRNRPGFDQVAAAVATAPGYMTNNLDEAITLARSIGDASARLQSLTIIFDNWASRDPGSAKSYLRTSTHLQAADRTEVMRRLGLQGN